MILLLWVGVAAVISVLACGLTALLMGEGRPAPAPTVTVTVVAPLRPGEVPVITPPACADERGIPCITCRQLNHEDTAGVKPIDFELWETGPTVEPHRPRGGQRA